MFAYIDSSQQGFGTELLCWINGLYLKGTTMRVLKLVSLFMIPSLCLFFLLRRHFPRWLLRTFPVSQPSLITRSTAGQHSHGWRYKCHSCLFTYTKPEGFLWLPAQIMSLKYICNCQQIDYSVFNKRGSHLYFNNGKFLTMSHKTQTHFSTDFRPLCIIQQFTPTFLYLVSH